MQNYICVCVWVGMGGIEGGRGPPSSASSQPPPSSLRITNSLEIYGVGGALQGFEVQITNCKLLDSLVPPTSVLFSAGGVGWRRGQFLWRTRIGRTQVGAWLRLFVAVGGWKCSTCSGSLRL